MASRSAYDRIWLATAGAVHGARLEAVVTALKQQASDELDVRPLAIENLPVRPPAERGSLPRRTAVLLALGDATGVDAAQRDRINALLEGVVAECERQHLRVEIIDLGGAAARAWRLRSLAFARVEPSRDAPALESLARELLRRLFPASKQSARPPPQRPDTDAAPAPAASRALQARELQVPGPSEPPSRGAEPAAAGDSVSASDAAADVRLGASAPARVAPGAEFTARFVAYPPADEAAVARLLTELSPRSEHRLDVHACRWRVGTVVTVRAAARHLDIAPTEQSFTWDGRRALLEFDAAVADDAPDATVVLKFDVTVDGIAVARLRLDLEITRATDRSDGALATSRAEAARSAFASYSSRDRERVLDRLAAVRIATGLDVFLDCLALNPGEQWKPRLEREIRARDLFLLFWSPESAASQWVEWEWRMALAAKGRDAMQIHPLVTGAKPPAELKDLHFGDVYMLVREAQVARRGAGQ